MRGRNNNGGSGNNGNRKGPNPLTRNYESNGPDVKIRGSAQQIAEKYAALARDAQSSGDRVMAENYLQHAEHYNRIIAAAQAQMPIQNVQANRDDFDEDGEEERDDFEQTGTGTVADAPAAPAGSGSGPQPVIEGTPAEIALNAEARESGGGREHNSRQRERRSNGGHGQNGQQRSGFQPREERNGQRGEQPGRAEATVASEQVAAEQPVSKPQAAVESVARSENLSPADLAARAELNEAASETAAPRRPRRPRRPRVSGDTAAEAAAPVEAASSEPVPSEG